MHFLCF
jgi:hypothetical protein